MPCLSATPASFPLPHLPGDFRSHSAAICSLSYLSLVLTHPVDWCRCACLLQQLPLRQVHVSLLHYTEIRQLEQMKHVCEIFFTNLYYKNSELISAELMFMLTSRGWQVNKHSPDLISLHPSHLQKCDFLMSACSLCPWGEIYCTMKRPSIFCILTDVNCFWLVIQTERGLCQSDRSVTLDVCAPCQSLCMCWEWVH